MGLRAGASDQTWGSLHVGVPMSGCGSGNEAMQW